MLKGRDPKDRTRSGIHTAEDPLHAQIGPEEKIRNIEALLKEAETLQDTAQQREYTKRITGLILEARTNLLAKFWDETGSIEYDALWASLDYATLNNTILAKSPDPDQVGETKGDKTIDDDVSCGNNGFPEDHTQPDRTLVRVEDERKPDDQPLLAKNHMHRLWRE